MSPEPRGHEPELETFRPKEVAKILKVSRGTIYRWMHDGLLPFVQIGDTYRIPADEVRRRIRPLDDSD